MPKRIQSQPNVDPWAILDRLPVGLFLADDSGRIVWVNRTLAEQVGVPVDQLLGSARSALPARRNMNLSKTSEIVDAPGVIPRVSAAATGERRFECITQKFSSADTVADGFEGELGCLIDASRYDATKRNRLLHPELREPGKLDPATGLLSKTFMQQELLAQVSRSRRYQNPLSVVLIRLADAEEVGEAVTALQTQRYAKAIAKMLKEKLRWVDIVGCWERDEFMLILPETGLEQSAKLTRKLDNYFVRLQREEGRVDPSATVIGIGTAEWTRGDDVTTLLARIEMSLRSSARNQVDKQAL